MRKYILILFLIIFMPACSLFSALGNTPTASPEIQTLTPTDTILPSPTPSETTSSFTPEPQVNPSGRPAPAFTSLDMVDSQIGWAQSEPTHAGEQIWRTQDGGYTWTAVGPPQPGSYPPDYVARTFFLDAHHAWVTYYPPQPLALGPSSVWATTDGGQTWTPGFTPPLDERIPDFAFESMTFIDPLHGWLMLQHSPGAGNAPVSLYGSQNGGINWELLVDPFSEGTARLNTCCRSGMLFMDEVTGIVGYAGGPIPPPLAHWTYDGGRTWESLELPRPTPPVSEFSTCGSGPPQNLGIGVVALLVQCFDPERPAPIALPFLYISTDDGTSWQVSPLPDELVNRAPLANFRRSNRVQFVSNTVGWLLVQDEDYANNEISYVQTHMFNTKDGGQTWEKIAQVSWAGIFDFIDDQIGWALPQLGTNTGLLHTQDGGSTWVALNPVTERP